MSSPADVLGVAPDADPETIVRAYRRRVMETHPDQGGSREAFKRVTDAFEALTAEDRPADEGADRAGVDPPGRPRRPEVEYVDYEAVDDRGWALDDADLFEKAAEAGLGPTEHGRIEVAPGESLLEAAEEAGFAWPYACRGGACANCAVKVIEGEMTMPANHVLPPEMVEAGVRLSCVSAPTTARTKVVFNVKHRPDLDDLRLPPHPFDLAHAGD